MKQNRSTQPLVVICCLSRLTSTQTGLLACLVSVWRRLSPELSEGSLLLWPCYRHFLNSITFFSSFFSLCPPVLLFVVKEVIFIEFVCLWLSKSSSLALYRYFFISNRTFLCSCCYCTDWYKIWFLYNALEWCLDVWLSTALWPWYRYFISFSSPFLSLYNWLLSKRWFPKVLYIVC